MTGFDAAREVLAKYLEEHGLKHTRQRDLILQAFMQSDRHATSDEIYQNVREENPSIGYTTVYRTMKLLCDAGLAEERHFDDGLTRYELDDEHHDHLVCLQCGRIIEFECTEIERAQTDVARQHDFELLRHRHELYGHCKSCRDS